MEQNVPCFSLHLVNLNKLPMYHDFLGPRGLQGTHMDTKEKSKSITFTVRGGFFTFWAILAQSGACAVERLGHAGHSGCIVKGRGV